MNTRKTETKGPDAVKAQAENKEGDGYVAQLEADNASLRAALAARVGVDASLAEVFENDEREFVQFVEAYAFGGCISEIDPSKWKVKSYKAEAGDIGLLPQREIDRLLKTEKETGDKIIETDADKFTDKDIMVRVFNPRTQKVELKKDRTVTVEEQRELGRLFG